MRQFAIGEKVRVLNHANKLFDVIGFKQEVYVYGGRTIDYLVYCLFCTNAKMSEIWVSQDLVYPDNRRKLTKQEIDELLDRCIDLMSMYEVMKMDEYKRLANAIMEELGKFQVKEER